MQKQILIVKIDKNIVRNGGENDLYSLKSKAEEIGGKDQLKKRLKSLTVIASAIPLYAVHSVLSGILLTLFAAHICVMIPIKSSNAPSEACNKHIIADQKRMQQNASMPEIFYILHEGRRCSFGHISAHSFFHNATEREVTVLALPRELASAQALAAAPWQPQSGAPAACQCAGPRRSTVSAADPGPEPRQPRRPGPPPGRSHKVAESTSIKFFALLRWHIITFIKRGTA